MTYEQKVKKWVKENTFFIYEKKCSNCEREIEIKFTNEILKEIHQKCDKTFKLKTSLGNLITIQFYVKSQKLERSIFKGYYKTNKPGFYRLGTKKMIKYHKIIKEKNCSIKID